jgi:hypothetical protein
MSTHAGHARVAATASGIHPGITIFGAPKPFINEHVATIQRNAIRSWQALGAEVLLIGEEAGIGVLADELGVRHLGEVERSAGGAPLVSSVFAAARKAATHRILVYANADVVLLDDLLPAVQSIDRHFEQFLLVGQRWDLDLRTRLGFSNGWAGQLRGRLATEGRLHPPAGSDYFGFPRELFEELPPFALGRAGWDNWMIFAARRMGIPVVDASQAITAIHQDHDYSHLAGGQPHHRLPESLENVRLGGGPETVFTLADATWRLGQDGLSRVHRPGGSFSGWLEAQVTLRLGPGRLARFLRLMLHPGLAIRRIRIEAGRIFGAHQESA